MINPSALDRRRWLTFVGATLALSATGCERRPESSSGHSGSGRSGSVGSSNSAATTSGPWVDDPALNRALQWLWNKQSRAADGSITFAAPGDPAPPPDRDGSWKSETYALLKSGRTLTPFLLHAMQQVRYKALPCGIHWSAAYDFVRRSIRPNGRVGRDADDIVEYPTYATALALQTLIAAPPDFASPELRASMVNYLVGQQCDEGMAFGGTIAGGGFSFGYEKPVGGSPGHVDIGHTRHALQALRAAGHDEPMTYRRAERFLRLLQKHPTEDRDQATPIDRTIVSQRRPVYDGGFYFSPVAWAANKGGLDVNVDQPYFRSYATATCDGILSLLACGVPRDDERITSARKWLERHPELDYPGGIPTKTNENWRESIRYYHFAVRAECYAALEWPGTWRDELRKIVVGLQQPDGSFVNREGALMKEDDPLVCTGLAVLALSRCAAG